MGAVYSFLAPHSPNPTTEFVLPPVTSEQRQLVLANGGIQPIAEGYGFIRSWGAMPSNPVKGLIQVKFLFSYNLLHFRSQSGLSNPPYSGFLYTYAATLGGMQTALYDFDSYIFQGGQGTLKEILPGGTTRGTGGNALTYRTIPASIESSPTGQWAQDGGDAYEVSVEFTTGVWWTNSDGSLDLFGAK